jgi:hypothetical protein
MSRTAMYFLGRFTKNAYKQYGLCIAEYYEYLELRAGRYCTYYRPIMIKAGEIKGFESIC